jgi:hypothetical protein
MPGFSDADHGNPKGLILLPSCLQDLQALSPRLGVLLGHTRPDGLVIAASPARRA